MALVSTTIRWDDAAHALVRAEAKDAGVGFAQFVREAALIRAAVRQAQREHPGRLVDMLAVAAEVERLAQVRRRT